MDREELWKRRKKSKGVTPLKDASGELAISWAKHLCPQMQAMANFANLTKSCYSHNGNEFGKISSNSQTNADKLNRWKPAMLADLTIWANVMNLAKFRQIAKCMQIS